MRISLLSLTGLAATIVALLPSAATAQRGMHYFHEANLPPGAVAQGQLAHLPALRGYVQPVEVFAPEGTLVSVKNAGQFSDAQRGSLRTGMQIGYVYQLRVSNIPFHEGFEVYPTIEVINRLFPPEGQKLRFPIPVELTQEELELALSGRFVTRVIYLEDNSNALPYRADLRHQEYFEAPPSEDPLLIADRLGRPMAILRMGSRVPDVERGAMGDSFGDAPVVIYPERPATNSPPGNGQAPGDQTEGDADAAVERSGRDFPRVPPQPRRASYVHPTWYRQAR